MTSPASMNSDDLPRVAQPALYGVIDAATAKSAGVVFAQCTRGSPRGLPPRALQRVREYIAAHLENNISLEVLAGVAGLSKSHFARAFKQSQGVAPHEYLMQCRVRRAQEVLAGTDMPLSKIACISGFSDQSHLTRRFRDHVGVTPSRYRDSIR